MPIPFGFLHGNIRNDRVRTDLSLHQREHTKIYSVADWSRNRKRSHPFGGAGAVTRCSSGSKPNVLHKWIIKNVTKCNSFFLFPFIFVNILIIKKIGEKSTTALRLTFCFRKVGFGLV
jgi:hypothetical protein